MLCVVTEVTERILAERRLQTLRELGVRASFLERASTAQDACRVAVETLAQNNSDVPFAVVILLDPMQQRAQPVAAVGADLEGLDLVAAGTGSGRGAALALGHGDAVTPQHAGRGSRATGHPRRTLAAAGAARARAPISAPGHEEVAALLVLGLSPRLVLDDAYQTFLEQVGVYLGRPSPTRAPMKRSVAVRKRWQRSIARRRRSSPTSATSSARPLTLLLGPVEDMVGRASRLPKDRASDSRSRIATPCAC